MTNKTTGLFPSISTPQPSQQLTESAQIGDRMERVIRTCFTSTQNGSSDAPAPKVSSSLPSLERKSHHPGLVRRSGVDLSSGNTTPQERERLLRLQALPLPAQETQLPLLEKRKKEDLPPIAVETLSPKVPCNLEDMSQINNELDRLFPRSEHALFLLREEATHSTTSIATSSPLSPSNSSELPSLKRRNALSPSL